MVLLKFNLSEVVEKSVIYQTRAKKISLRFPDFAKRGKFHPRLRRKSRNFGGIRVDNRTFLIYAGSASGHTPPLADVSPQDFLNPSKEGTADAGKSIP